MDDLRNLRFGRLLVIDQEPIKKKGRSFWACMCDCGKTKLARSDTLMSGRIKSCGCFQKDQLNKYRYTPHGQAANGKSTKEYYAWADMKKRCSTNKLPEYKNYKLRGITVCERWLNSAKNFIEDMGPAPTKDHMLERKDNDKGYSPDNCVWATRTEQNRNRRDNIWFECEGEQLTQTDLAKRFNIYPGYIVGMRNQGYTNGEVVNSLQNLELIVNSLTNNN